MVAAPVPKPRMIEEGSLFESNHSSVIAPVASLVIVV